ncbi:MULTISPECIES: small, acid-soluble spore protein, alpha/beta type [Alicyclobacillus]|uniref:small, acid-soluble spore protein, alpha/beta type n=1 Tax=Alicyclobacillus TaxID=29330 RepID=UPI001A8F3528|nr:MULTISPECIES: small, acid-soluble spore protein, alpha/beta type [Alicyclobacillus]MCL6489132.1 alpha/beta-type small acid-soluble spore protein [Alicyclobacillus mali (ex Roth et al. 2021)]
MEESGVPKVNVIGPDGKIRQVPWTVPEKPSAAKLVADRLGVGYAEGEENGQLTSKQAGEIGGHLGGPMVAKLVALAKRDLAHGHVEQLIQKQKATPESRL